MFYRINSVDFVEKYVVSCTPYQFLHARYVIISPGILQSPKSFMEKWCLDITAFVQPEFELLADVLTQNRDLFIHEYGEYLEQHITKRGLFQKLLRFLVDALKEHRDVYFLYTYFTQLHGWIPYLIDWFWSYGIPIADYGHPLLEERKIPESILIKNLEKLEKGLHVQSVLFNVSPALWTKKEVKFLYKAIFHERNGESIEEMREDLAEYRAHHRIRL